MLLAETVFEIGFTVPIDSNETPSTLFSTIYFATFISSLASHCTNTFSVVICLAFTLFIFIGSTVCVHGVDIAINEMSSMAKSFPPGFKSSSQITSVTDVLGPEFQTAHTSSQTQVVVDNVTVGEDKPFIVSLNFAELAK